MITAQTVKELREKTGAGMADCKKALEEASGDMQLAVDWLRKRGAASVAKRSDRDANEGIVIAKTSTDGKTAVIVEVNCETDFVARNDQFQTKNSFGILKSTVKRLAIFATRSFRSSARRLDCVVTSVFQRTVT